MNKVLKYTREYFADTNVSKQKDAVKNFKPKDINNKDITFNKEDFTGSKTEIKNKVDKNVQLKNIVQQYGGIENLFELLDENGDKKVSIEEINDIALVDCEDLKSNSEQFSTKDLEMIYENAIASEGAKITQYETVSHYEYTDGMTTDLFKDNKGNVTSKYIETRAENNERVGKGFIYDSEITYDVVKDKNGMIRALQASSINDTTPLYETNGNVEDTYQGTIGDCWILAGINGLKDTDAGKNLISKAIKQNIDGSVTVTLKGVNKSYTYSPEKIGALEYSNPDKVYSVGDTDMNLFEMAIEDYRKELFSKGIVEENMTDANIDDPLEGGRPEDVLFYLTGKNPTSTEALDKKIEMLNNKQNNDDKFILVLDFKQDDDEMMDVVSGHAYNVTKVTEDTVYIVNPNDSSYEIEYPKDKFLKLSGMVSCLEL